MQRESSSSVRIYYPKFSKEEVIQKLKQGVKALEEKLPLSSMVLFGSYAKGNYTASSDIDLLVVYKGTERADAFAIVKKTLAIPMLEPHVYSEFEYEKMKDVVLRMIEDGITIVESITSK